MRQSAPPGPALVPACPDGSWPRRHPAAPGLVPRQRRRSILALGVVLACIGALAGAWVFTSFSHRADGARRRPRYPRRHRDHRRRPGTGAGLGRQRHQGDPGPPGIPGRRGDRRCQLRAGTLLVPADLTATAVPGPGQQLVPVTLKASQLPASGLAPGDQVLVVATPGAAGQAASGSGQAPLGQDVPAAVYQVSAPDTSGDVVVDLLVGAGQGPAVAQQDSTGQIALIITAAGGAR